MGSKVQAVLEANKRQGTGSLIAYYPLGYPTLGESITAIKAIAEAGADVIEMGIPYSDPVMDGPVIQEATELALANGFKLNQLFDALGQITAAVDVPILVMSYWNPIMQYGIERFAKDLKASGGAGLITPDLIPDEGAQWISLAESLDLDHVFLATPSSSAKRTKLAVESSRGFVYAVSTMGITGERGQVDQNAREVVAAIHSADPKAFAAVGIGISTPDQVEQVNEYADAAIVGSAIVRAHQTEGVLGLSKLVSKLASSAKIQK